MTYCEVLTVIYNGDRRSAWQNLAIVLLLLASGLPGEQEELRQAEG